MPRTITCTPGILRGGPDAFPAERASGGYFSLRPIYPPLEQANPTPPPYEQCLYGAPHNEHALGACPSAAGAQPPGNDDPANPKNHSPKPARASPTETI